ncbi:MAG: DMT family transporter [Planctomycetota bacterium]
MAPSPILVHAALVLVSLLFGLNYVASKVVVDAVPPRAWVFYRVASAALLLLPLLIWRRHRWPARPLWGWLLLAATLGVCLNQTLFLEGLQRTVPSHSAIVNTSIPILTLTFASAVGQERLTLRKVLAVLVALAGVLTLLEVDRTLADIGQLGAYVIGDLLTLGNAASFSMFIVVMRHLGRRVDPVAATLVCFLMGTAVLGAYSSPVVDSDNLGAMVRPDIWPYAVFAIVGATVLTYLLNNWALGHVESSLVVLYIYVQPIVATGWQTLRGAPLPGPRFYVAAVLVCAGILLATLARRRESLRLGARSVSP